MFKKEEKMEIKKNNYLLLIIIVLVFIVGLGTGYILSKKDVLKSAKETKTEEKQEEKETKEVEEKEKAKEQESEEKEEEQEKTKEEYKSYHIVRKDGLWSKDFVDGKGKFTLKNKKTINFEIKDEKGSDSKEVLYVENNKINSYAIIYKLGIMDNGLIVVDYGKDEDQVETHYRDYYDENYKKIKTIESIMNTPDILATEFHQIEYTGECRNENQRIDNENSVVITSDREFIIKFIKEIKSDNCAGMV